MWQKNKKTFCQKKVLVGSKMPKKIAPLKTLKLFLAKCFIILCSGKMLMQPFPDFFKEKTHMLTTKVFVNWKLIKYFYVSKKKVFWSQIGFKNQQKPKSCIQKNVLGDFFI